VRPLPQPCFAAWEKLKENPVVKKMGFRDWESFIFGPKMPQNILMSRNPSNPFSEMESITKRNLAQFAFHSL